MGLILPQTIKVRTSVMTYKHYKEKGYKFEKCGDLIEINVLDLKKKSNVKVKVVCDICGKEGEMCYSYVVKCNEEDKLITCGSDSCKHKKYEDTCIKKYGEGITNPFQTESVKEKSKQTLLKNYGVDCPIKSSIIQNKIKDTNLKRYGSENPSKVKEIKDKKKATCKKHFGVESPMQNEEIKNKVLNSCQFNSTGPCSRAQRYINHILNGTLNKPICGSLTDIYIEKENIIIEHDGGGHFLGDKINGNAFPTKEALLREKEREDKIINNGYRMIRFIANKDRIPSDEVILNLVEGFKNSDFKVIRINFEEGTIDRDYDEKWYCNFGELRKITQKDLEQFEKQEENTLEN